MTKSNESCVLIFVKYPEKGKVKKRLSEGIEEAITVELYQNFVLDSLSMLEKLGVKFLICFYPGSYKEKFMEWLGNKYCYIPQKGRNLGQRMKNSFIQAFKRGFHRVITIGSDSPDLPAAFIKEAFGSLETHDAVIGPSFDGGYYLIGFKDNTFLPEAFEGINWSTNTVFNDTLNILEKIRYKVYILPEWNDVDTIDDLKRLIHRNLEDSINKNAEFTSSRTISYLLKRMFTPEI